MKKIYVIIIVMCLGITSKAQINVPDIANDKNWKPLTSDSAFNEEFDYTSYTDFNRNAKGIIWNPTVWGWDHDPINHNEQIYWSKDDNNDTTMVFHPDPNFGTGSANPDSSFLRIYLKRKHGRIATYISKNGTDSFVTCDYVTTPLSSSPKWKFGYFEISYRSPDWTATEYRNGNVYKTDLAGMSNAIWMYDQDKAHGITWSEIDLFENSTGKNDLAANIHFLDTVTMSSRFDTYTDWDNHTYADYRKVPSMLYNNQWHTVSMEWTPKYVRIFNDGVLSMENTTHADELTKMGLIIGPDYNAYYNILGYRIDSFEIGDANTKFPYYVDLNHVKIWKLNMDSCGGTPTVLNKLDATTYPYGVKKSIRITGTASSVITSGQKVTLRANDFIQIDKNFEARLGATFEMIPTPCEQ